MLKGNCKPSHRSVFRCARCHLRLDNNVRLQHQSVLVLILTKSWTLLISPLILNSVNNNKPITSAPRSILSQACATCLKRLFSTTIPVEVMCNAGPLTCGRVCRAANVHLSRKRRRRADQTNQSSTRAKLQGIAISHRVPERKGHPTDSGGPVCGPPIR